MLFLPQGNKPLEPHTSTHQVLTGSCPCQVLDGRGAEATTSKTHAGSLAEHMLGGERREIVINEPPEKKKCQVVNDAASHRAVGKAGKSRG